MPKDAEHRDIVGDIIAFESGEMDRDETIEFFQRLVDSGMAWSLQGSYGRTAAHLIESGMIADTHGVLAAQAPRHQAAQAWVEARQ